MGFFSRAKKVASLFVNWRVDKMMGYNNIKDNATYFYSTFMSLFVPEYPKIEESFEEAVERLNLTSEEIKQKATLFKFYMYLFLAISFLLFAYSFYIFSNDNWMGAIMSFTMAFYPLTQAFRYHFWQFQIRNQKLGCSLREWLSNNIQKQAPKKALMNLNENGKDL